MHVVCSDICFDNTITGNCKRCEFVLGEFNYEKLVLILAHENDYLFDNTVSEASLACGIFKASPWRFFKQSGFRK